MPNFSRKPGCMAKAGFSGELSINVFRQTQSEVFGRSELMNNLKSHLRSSQHIRKSRVRLLGWTVAPPKERERQGHYITGHGIRTLSRDMSPWANRGAKFFKQKSY
jgi:hypothetical protein